MSAVPETYKAMLAHTNNPNEAFNNASELAAIGDWREAERWHSFGQWWVKNPTVKEITITVGVSNG